MEIQKAIRPEGEKPEKQKPVKKKKKPAKKIERAIDKLKPAHKMFVKEYVANLGNGCRAYLKAYPKVKTSTATVEASKLLTKPYIQKAVKDEYELYFKKKDSEAEKSKTYQMIHSIGSTPISDVIDMEGRTLRVKSMDEIPPEAIHAIKSVKRTERTNQFGTDVTLEVTLHDKLSALKLRAQMQGLLEADNSSTVEIVVTNAERPEEK